VLCYRLGPPDLTQRTCFPQAPELLSRRIETFDARALLATDVFSLGVTLFHVLTRAANSRGPNL
jgi:hypothetical protein